MEISKIEKIFKDLEKINKKKETIEHNIFEISGFPSRETVYSNLLAFYLDSNEEHKLGDLLIRSLLEATNISNIHNTSDLTIEREYYTNNGNYIDIVIYNDEFVLGIENKIWATVYNDLEDYAHTIELINPNSYKIILSLKNESRIANKYKFINITYKELFKIFEPKFRKVFDYTNKWHIILNDFIQSIKRLGANNMENKEVIEWAKKNKENIENFRDFISTIKKELNLKAKQLGNILIDEIKMLNLNGRVWYWNTKGLSTKELCTVIAIELEEYDIAIDTKISVDGWGIYITLRKENFNTTRRKQEIIEKLEKNNIKLLNNDVSKMQIEKLDYYSDYEFLKDKVIEILKIFQ